MKTLTREQIDKLLKDEEVKNYFFQVISNNGIITTIQELKNHYIEDTMKRKANQSSNNIIINLIDKMTLAKGEEFLKRYIVIKDISNGFINYIFSKNGLFNRGVAGELLVKLFYLNTTYAEKNPCVSGFEFNGKHFDMITCTNNSRAYFNAKTQTLKNLIALNTKGLFYCKNGLEKIKLYDENHITNITSYDKILIKF